MKYSSRDKEIENIASMMLIENNVFEPFVDVDQIISNKNITSTPYGFDEQVSGVLVIKDNVATIGYNQKNSVERIRFTKAHELAHYTLHWKPTSKINQEVFVDKDLFMKFRNTNNDYNPEEVRQEIEANMFAAALLMPKHFIEKELNRPEYQRLEEANIIKMLANKFKVSEPAMTYRLTNLQMFY